MSGIFPSHCFINKKPAHCMCFVLKIIRVWSHNLDDLLKQSVKDKHDL